MLTRTERSRKEKQDSFGIGDSENVASSKAEEAAGFASVKAEEVAESSSSDISPLASFGLPSDASSTSSSDTDMQKDPRPWEKKSEYIKYNFWFVLSCTLTHFCV